MMIFELVGISGCGKTTATRMVVSRLSQCGYKVLYLNQLFSDRKEFICRAVRSFFRNGGELYEVIKCWIHYCFSISEIPKSIVFRVFSFELVQLLYAYDLIKDDGKKYDCIISDQWIFQHIFTLLHKEHVNSYKELIDSIDKRIFDLYHDDYELIVVQTSLEKILDQILNRQNGRSMLDFLDETDIKKIFAVQSQNLNYFLGKNFQTAAIEVSFDCSMQEASQRLCDVIEEKLERLNCNELR